MQAITHESHFQICTIIVRLGATTVELSSARPPLAGECSRNAHMQKHMYALCLVMWRVILRTVNEAERIEC